MSGGSRVISGVRFRSFSALLTIGALALGATLVGPASPAAAGEPETIYSLVNQARASNGQQALLRNSAMDQVALNWANQMAASGVMSHNPNYASQIPAGWTRAGENVAYGQSSGTAVHTAWMNSAGHRANILGDFTDIGIAFISARGTTWSVEVFAKYPSHISPGTAAFVKALYADVLGRAPGASEVSGWGLQLMRGVPAVQVASGFVNSDEYRLIRIRSAYQSILGRAGETTGVYGWLDGMKRGVLGTDDVDRVFLATDEYLMLSGGTNESFVAALYQRLLNRPIASAEVSGWAAIATASGRQAVVDGIRGAVESARQRVTVMYQAYLGRTPAPGEVDGWAYLALAQGDAGVRWSIVASAEYWGRASARFPA